VQILRAVGCVGLLVALVGCGGAGGGAAPSGETKNVEVTASMDPTSISVLVTFVGGPADGRTEYLTLPEASGKVTIDGVTYWSNPGPPPEVKDTPEGAAQVMRPV
jgi:hypothetical protein